MTDRTQLLRTTSGASFFNMGMGLMARGPMVTRQPENDGGAGGGQDNPQGNSGGNNNDSGGGNNAGTGFDPSAFWAEPKPAAPASPSGGSAESGSAGDGQQQQNQGRTAGQELAQRIESLPFGEVFSTENIEQLTNGDLSGVNKAIQSQLRESARHSLTMSAQLIQQVIPHLMGQMEEKIKEALGNRDNADTLLQHFPAAKDPAARPMIQSVFDQALKLSGGDRVKAVEATKEMLKHFGKTAATDMDINLPPSNPADTFTTPNSTRLVDELLGRQT